MEKLRALLEKTVSQDLDSIVVSSPRKQAATTEQDQSYKALSAGKIKIRPVLLADGLVFQMTSYVGTQVFHENLKKDVLIDALTDLMQSRFGQLQLETDSLTATALVSKKGTVTVKEKKKPVGRNGQMKNLQNAENMRGMVQDGTKTTDVYDAAGMQKPPARDLSHNRQKHYILPEGVPVPFLYDLGVQTKDGRIIKSRYDKFRQINRFLEFIEDILPALPTDREISILDFGCGKSYLTFAMYYYLKELKGYDISVVGLDLKKDVISHCNELAVKYGYQKLTFLEGDVKDYHEKDAIDMVVTLHACDTATDIAIARAIAWNARVILSVPCCQHELNRQISCKELAPVLRYGLLKERMAALLTDGIRACTMEAYGYETQVLEFIDMEHTPKNILLRGIKTEGMRKKSISMDEVQGMMDMLHTGQTLVSLLS